MRVQEVSSLEEAERVSAKRRIPFLIAEADPRFRMRFASHDLTDGITATLVAGERARAVATRRMAARADRDDLLMFFAQVAGSVRLRQHDRSAELTCGAGALTEARSPWELNLPVANENFGFQFPRELLPMTSAQIADSCARLLAPRSPAMRLLAGYLGSLHSIADELADGQRREAGQVAIDLLTMALRDVAPAVPAADTGGEVVLRMMQTYVREHLADPSLSVEELAQRHHVSVRHVHTLFARAGGTPGAYIRERRLSAARALLSAPRYDTRAVADIAAAVGFTELRTFERAFRRQYGTAPARWRRERREQISSAAAQNSS